MEIFGADWSRVSTRFEELRSNHWGEEYLTPAEIWNHLTSESRSAIRYSHTYWFHATRTFDPNVFRQGILPLQAVLDSIWDSLAALVNGRISAEQWNGFRAQIERGKFGMIPGQHEVKFDLEKGGPFGFLVLDRVFVDDHFLHMPEIVEAICEQYERCFPEALGSLFLQKTTPCIVKFRTDNFKPVYLIKALNYLWEQEHGLIPSFDSHACHNGEGIAVAPSQVVKIMYSITSVRF